MGLSLGLSFAVSVALVSLGNTGLSIFTTEAGALVFATTRLWHVELLECLPSTYEITAGALRGMGWSILPTVVVIIGSCVLRVIYVFTLFPLLGSFEALLNIYPVTWFVTGATIDRTLSFRKEAHLREGARKDRRTRAEAGSTHRKRRITEGADSLESETEAPGAQISSRLRQRARLPR